MYFTFLIPSEYSFFNASSMFFLTSFELEILLNSFSDITLDINTVVTDSEGTKYKNYVTVLHKDDKLGKDVVIQEGNKKVSILEE